MERFIKLTATYDPKALSAPAPDIHNYEDYEFPFLRLKVSSRRRVWQFQKSHQRKHLKRKIGDAMAMSRGEAALIACEWVRNLEQGLLPMTVEERSTIISKKTITVEKIFEAYFRRHVALHCKTCGEIDKEYKRYWSTIAHKRINQLTARVVSDWFVDLSKRGKATANKQLILLRASLNWARKNNVIEKNEEDVTTGIQLHVIHGRTAYLKKGEEEERLHAALNNAPQDVQDAIKVFLWTGQRKTNCITMRWSELDLNESGWLIPAVKTKTGKDYAVALTPLVVEILKRRYAERTSDTWVFPSEKKGEPYSRQFNRAWEKIRTEAKLDDLTIHGLRHTAATWLGKSGASTLMIKQAMQHASINTSSKYAHLETNDVRDIMTAIQKRKVVS